MARPLTEPSSGDGKTNCRKTATTSEGGNSRSYGTTCRSQEQWCLGGVTQKRMLTKKASQFRVEVAVLG